MKYEIIYNTNEQLWKMERIAEETGFSKTEECYWVQIFENGNGDSIVCTRENDIELNHDPVKRLNDLLNPEEEEEEEQQPEETEQKKTDRENRARCQHIAEEIESYADGNMYRCPECGEIIQWQNEQYNIDEATYTCPCCNSEFDESDLEALSLYDYFEDVLDIEFRVGSNKELRSVSLMVTCGGPNIYIDTEKKAVLLCWGTNRAEYPLSYDVCEEINAWAEELWNC